MNCRTHRQEHGSSSLLFVLVLYAAMLLIGVMLIVMGAGVYRNVLDSMDSNDEERTASAYLMQKTRQTGDAGAIRAGKLDGCDAILLQDSISGETYVTYLYCDDGSLKELLVRADNEYASAAAGSEVLDLTDMTIEEAEDGASLLVTLTLPDGTVQKLRIRTG